MENAVQRINPNAELIALNKYDAQFRRYGFTPRQTMQVKKIVFDIRRENECIYIQKLPLVIFSIMINVLHSNKYLSKKKIEATLEEAVDLYKEIDLSLLDIDDVLNYNKNEVGMEVILEHPELVYCDKPTFKVSTMVTHQNRTSSIMEQVEKELRQQLSDEPENEDEVHFKLQLLNDLKRRFKKADIIA